MLFFAKVRIDIEKLAEYGERLQSGSIETHPLCTYCLTENPAVGLNIWEAEDRDDFDTVFAPHAPYSQVVELVPVITAQAAQRELTERANVAANGQVTHSSREQVSALLPMLRPATLPYSETMDQTVNDEPLAQRIYRRAHLNGEFVLRSGAVSDQYFDKYLFESDPILLREVAQELVGLLPHDVEVIAGLELGGVPLATMVSQLTGLPTLFVRKQAKTYGTCRLAEGGDIEHRRIAVVEDVVSTGGQLIESCAALRERGAEILGVLCVIDRESGGTENLLAHDLKLSSVFAMTELERWS